MKIAAEHQFPFSLQFSEQSIVQEKDAWEVKDGFKFGPICISDMWDLRLKGHLLWFRLIKLECPTKYLLKNLSENRTL
uniref:Uncharacterized protein n=1 Tax=Arion vulgaris TaxID=1028688 RepID=A0A0B6ZNX2_9EUPU